MRTSSSLAIIIVNWNGYQYSKSCLLSLRDLKYQSYEIILVDNGSADKSGDRLKEEFPEVRLISLKTNTGFTGGNNAGIEYALKAKKDLIMLLNNDTVVTPDFADILVKRLESNEKGGAVQPKIMFNKERSIIWNGGTKFSKIWFTTKTIGLGQKDNGQHDLVKDVPWITGCCFLVRSSVIKEVGTLDNHYFAYYEDVDWSFRIKRAGYKLIYEPSALIFHEVGKANENMESFGEGNLSPFSHYVNMRNHIFVIRKHAKGIAWATSFLYQFYKLFGYSLYFLFRGRFKKLKASIRGFYDGATFQI